MNLLGGVSLRPALETDYNFLRTLFASTRTRELAYLPGGEAGQQLFINSQFSAQSESYRRSFPQAVQYIIEVAGQPAGRMYVDHSCEPLHLVDLSLLPEHRQRGIGTCVLQSLLAEAGRSGGEVSLNVEMSNPAIRLYERLGFKTVRSDGVYQQMLASGLPLKMH